MEAIEDKFGNVVYREGDSLFIKSVTHGKIVSLGFIKDNGGTWLTRRISKNVFFDKYYAFNAVLVNNAKSVHLIRIETDLDGKPKELIEVPLAILIKHGIPRDIYHEESILVPLEILREYIV